MPSTNNAVMLDPNAPEFDSADQAAKALTSTFDSKEGLEHSGAIVKKPSGKYTYTSTIPGTENHFDMRVLIPKDHTFAGIVHSHPSTEDLGQVFSPNDLQQANQFKVPSYVYFNKDKSVRRYTPGASKTRLIEDPNHPAFSMRVAEGDLVPPNAPPPGAGYLQSVASNETPPLANPAP